MQEIHVRQEDTYLRIRFDKRRNDNIQTSHNINQARKAMKATNLIWRNENINIGQLAGTGVHETSIKGILII
jgi:hypothetical protein